MAKRILIADDSPIIRKIIRHDLESGGYHNVSFDYDGTNA